MNIPNTLTLIRLTLAPVFLLIFFSNIPNAMLIAFLVFLFAGLTDMLDGYLARKYNLVTELGSVLDPLADKTMSIIVLLSLTIKNMIPIWIILTIGAKELLMIVGGIILFRRNSYIPAQPYGKIATILFYVSIITLEVINKPLGLILIYATMASALFALYKYYINFSILRAKASSR